MLELRPIRVSKDSSELLSPVPSELLALAITAAAPWTSYVAYNQDGIAVGSCAFKSAPNATREVEIAYVTFSGFEKRGYGTAMTQSLFEIAVSSGEVEHVIAQTLPEENASVRICRRLEFVFDGESIDPEDGFVWRWRKPTRSLTRD